MGLGKKGLMEDLCVSVEVQVNTDSSAAKSIRARKGAGRVRHIGPGAVGSRTGGKRRAKDSKGARRRQCGGWFEKARRQAEDGAVHESMRDCTKEGKT